MCRRAEDTPLDGEREKPRPQGLRTSMVDSKPHRRYPAQSDIINRPRLATHDINWQQPRNPRWAKRCRIT